MKRFVKVLVMGAILAAVTASVAQADQKPIWVTGVAQPMDQKPIWVTGADIRPW